MDHLSLHGGGVAGQPFPQSAAASSGVTTITVNPSSSIGNSESGTTEYKMISHSAPSSPTANVTLPDGQKIIGEERKLTEM